MQFKEAAEHVEQQERERARERRKQVIADIEAERARQQAKWGEGEMWHALAVRGTAAEYGLPSAEAAEQEKRVAFDSGNGDWVRIITAEVCRFARAALLRNNEEARRYAVRIAAVACAIAESLTK
jgi:hypothetical protein